MIVRVSESHFLCDRAGDRVFGYRARPTERSCVTTSLGSTGGQMTKETSIRLGLSLWNPICSTWWKLVRGEMAMSSTSCPCTGKQRSLSWTPAGDWSERQDSVIWHVRWRNATSCWSTTDLHTTVLHVSDRACDRACDRAKFGSIN